MTDHISDKAIWSAAKSYYLRHGHTEQQWSALSDQERDTWRAEYLEHQERQPKSAHQLMAELRKARIDNVILERKLAAANAKIAQLEASAALIREMNEDAEPSCP